MDRTVLIIEDEKLIIVSTQMVLESVGFRVESATDGEEGIRKARDLRPDLILLDIMMPRRSGFEVCRLLKDDPRYRDIPIVMVTALNEVGDMERARECGADDFLSKPVNKIELLARVQNLLRLRHLKRALNRPGSETPDER